MILVVDDAMTMLVEILSETFSGESSRIEYRKTVEDLYAQGIKVLDNILRYERVDGEEPQTNASIELAPGISKNDAQTIEKLSIRIDALSDPDTVVEFKSNSLNEERKSLNKQLDVLKTQSEISEIIHTGEHREYLDKALKEAKYRVMIVSPWIRRNIESVKNLAS